MLDHETGLDPPDIKLRAAMGFDATDFFVTGYVPTICTFHMQ